MDFFNRLDVPALDRLGDTALPLRSASAYDAAGLSKPSVPVVFNGDGTQTQQSLSDVVTSMNPMDAYRYGKQLGTSTGNAIADATGISGLVNSALLGAAGIALLAVGAYMLLRD